MGVLPYFVGIVQVIVTVLLSLTSDGGNVPGILFSVAINVPRSPGKVGTHHWMRTNLGLLST